MSHFLILKWVLMPNPAERNPPRLHSIIIDHRSHHQRRSMPPQCRSFFFAHQHLIMRYTKHFLLRFSFFFFSGNFIVRQYLMLNAPNTEWSGKSFFFLSFMFSLASSTLTRVCERRDQKIFSMSEVLRREIFLEGWRAMMGLEKLMVS